MMKNKSLLFVLFLVLSLTVFAFSSQAAYDPHDLSDFGYRTVVTGGRGNLVFQRSQGGSFMKEHSFKNGDSIYVNLYWLEKGYALAYEDGEYGFVDASYIDWGEESDDYDYDPHDLSDFGYRTVKTGGRGNLVFQRSQGGSFMKEHSFKNGESIYVNLYWIEDGYALAYENGDYGFVDASYIDWGTSSSSYDSYDPHDLSDFGYRTVKTNGRGNLVFQRSQGGSFMKEHSFKNGESIYVNLYWMEDGYALAYEDGDYGFVDASYIDWSEESDDYDYDPYDLSDFGYRTVKTGGRGNLVFQRSPGGSFMKNHSFKNGDRIRVNLYWIEDGYALAYEGGDYGFVDASYIDW